MDATTRLQRWESRVEWPLAGVAAAFLVAYSVQVLARPRGLGSRLIDGILDALYLAFVIDYVARLLLAKGRTRWFFTH
jgi:voltage-gated potassium channel